MFLVFICAFSPFSRAAEGPLQPYKTTEPPTIDGKLDDPVWQNSPIVTDFKTFVPDYGKEMSEKTKVYLAYDRENLYFAFRCYDRDPKKIKASITNRDKISDDDWVCINLDSFNDQQALYRIYVNPLGVQGDTRFTIGNEDWGFDMVWYSSGRIDEQGYSVEVRLPLKSIRFKHGKEVEMGVIFERKISRRSELGTFPALDPKQSMALLNQMYPMVFVDLKRFVLLEVLPAVTYHQTYSRKENRMEKDGPEKGLSLTMKYGLTSRLVLDGAVNPDFSQIEADAGQVDANLRYQLYYPEKRPFFLEGRGHFNLGGNVPLNSIVYIFHTRTIADPILGVKLSGKVGDRDSLSVLYALDRVPDYDTRAAFSIFRYKRSMKDDGYIGGIYADRKFGEHYNRIMGADGRFRLGKSDTIDFYSLISQLDDEELPNTREGHAVALGYSRVTRKLGVTLGFNDLSKFFQADMGYITRTGITRLTAILSPKFYPEKRFLRRIDSDIFLSACKDKESGLWETYNRVTVIPQIGGATTFVLRYAYSSEIFLQQRFRTSGFTSILRSRINKQLFLSLIFRSGKAIYYSEDPQQGYQNVIKAQLVFQPSEKVKSEIAYNYAGLYRESDRQKIFDYSIFRLKQTYQVNKYLFFRGIVEYNGYWKELLTDFLASFTYIPGTVIHLGYGSLYNRQEWQDDRYIDVNRFIENKRSFFFKASYLWRF
jgi:hypothetical protein